MSDLNPDLASIAAQALDAVAKHLNRSGQVERARALVRQAAEIELLSPELQDCWGGPFNGQTGRLAIVEELLDAVAPAAIVETGTFRGISTSWFARAFAGPVWSCEAEELYLIQARHRLREHENVELRLADSRAFLRDVVPSLKANAPAFFYLDAHWKQDLPLRQELQIIFDALPKAVVMVDDFRIPQDAGYGWDDYGPGIRVDATVLAGAVPPGASFYVPGLPSSDETGARRGCCVVAWKASGAVDLCRSLQRRSLSDLMPPADEQKAARDEASADPAGVGAKSLVAKLRNEIAVLNLDRAQRLQDIATLNREIASTVPEAEALKAERVIQLGNNEMLSREVHRLQARVAEVEADRAQRLQDIVTLNREIASTLRETEALKAQRVIQLENNETLTSEVHRLQARVAEVEAHSGQRLRDVQTLSEYVLRYEREVETLKAERASHLSDNGTLTAQIHGLEASIEGIEKDRAQRLTDVLNLTEEIASLRRKG